MSGSDALGAGTPARLAALIAEKVCSAAQLPAPRFGMNLHLWTPTVTPAFFPLLRQLRAIGFGGIEVPIVGGTQQHLAARRRALDDEGLACTMLRAVTPATRWPSFADTDVDVVGAGRA